jgi:hypothetical protein
MMNNENDSQVLIISPRQCCSIRTVNGDDPVRKLNKKNANFDTKSPLANKSINCTADTVQMISSTECKHKQSKKFNDFQYQVYSDCRCCLTDGDPTIKTR